MLVFVYICAEKQKIMIPKNIDLSEWERFGCGASGDSFYHKSDPSVMLKLYFKGQRPQWAENEYVCSKKVYDLGIPCPATYDFVTAEDRLGITFERVMDKVSFATKVAGDPTTVDDVAKEFARLARILHSTPCDTSLFKSQKQIYVEHFNNGAFLPELRDGLLRLVDELGDETTCLHGDLHFGNAVFSGDKSYLIDLGDFSYGNPVIDMVEMFMICFVASEENCRSQFHMELPLAQAFCTKYICHYYGISTKEEIEEKMQLLTHFLPLQIAHMSEGRTDYWDLIQKRLLERLKA